MDLKDYLNDRGASAELARVLKIPNALISQWRNGVRPVPAERCPAIERVTQGKVRCEDLRPDVDWAYLRGTAAANDSVDRAA